MVDTLVMANLGYWQMKVNPGVWYLQLAPGRSSELYVMKDDSEGSKDTTLLKRITIDNLRGKLVHMEVIKKKGKERETLLIPSDDTQSADHKVRSYSSHVFFIYLVSYEMPSEVIIWITHEFKL